MHFCTHIVFPYWLDLYWGESISLWSPWEFMINTHQQWSASAFLEHQQQGGSTCGGGGLDRWGLTDYTWQTLIPGWSFTLHLTDSTERRVGGLGWYVFFSQLVRIWGWVGSRKSLPCKDFKLLDSPLGSSHYIIRMTSPPMSWNYVQQLTITPPYGFFLDARDKSQ